MAEIKRVQKCPHCKKLASWEKNQFRPFCSERCKMIDLGAWSAEEYAISTYPTSEAEAEEIDEAVRKAEAERE